MNDRVDSPVVKKRKPAFVLVACLLVVLVSLFLRHYLTEDHTRSNTSPLADFLSSDPDKKYASVLPGYRLRFPADHGAHPEFRQEWWYFTGNLLGNDNREYGYQLTFFRFAHGRSDQLPATGWNNDQTWMAHLALTDVAGEAFYTEEDFARGAIDLAGAEARPFNVWVNGWSAKAEDPTCDECLDVRLIAVAEKFAIDLQVSSERGPVLQGQNGFSIKNRKGDVASYYYSYPNLRTTGQINIAGTNLSVKGTSWMDREWSSTGLAKSQSGWDWFALHFDDGRKLMLFQVREETAGDFRHGVIIDPEGGAEQIPADELVMTPVDYWTSNATGNRYPVRWRIKNKLDNNKLDVRIHSKLENQELDLSFQYYEGAVEVRGVLEGTEVNGSGYMELTGYER